MREKTNKILIHTCCAICSGYPITYLRELNYEPIAYFFNPNIFPFEEYQKRLDAQKKLCLSLKCELIIEEYNDNAYKKAVNGLENCHEGGERCTKCFELRLNKAAAKAKELGIENFDTSISISPHKNYSILKSVGEDCSKVYDINFLGLNYKKQDGFLKTNKIANGLKLYRQKYCGCEFSIIKPKKTEEINK